MTPLRIWLIGSGAVGTWLLGVLDAQAGRLASRYGAEVTVVGLANARDGFVYDPGGLDLPSVLAALSEGGRSPASAGHATGRARSKGFPPPRPTCWWR